MFPLPLPRLLRRSALALSALVALPSIRACGPDFPNAYLVMPGERLAALPTLDFASEIARVFPPRNDVASLRPVSTEAAEAAEREEWRTALAAAGLTGERIAALLEKLDRAAPPAELPREFQLYGAGAAAWRAKDFPAAIALWRELLALPAAERPRRSVWAAYMLGRTLREARPDEACRMFQLTRELAAQGFTDSQGLALASLGEEARAPLERQDHAGALRLYLQQQRFGDSSALASLQLTLQAVFALDDTAAAPKDDGAFTPSPLRALAAERDLRALVTAWFVARGGPHTPWTAHAVQRFRRWIEALPTDASLTPAEADRWAWAAYQNGLWEQAGLFARFAAPDAPASEWVRAMLFLREGRVEDAAAHLANAAKAFPQDAALSSTAFAADGDRRFRATQQDLPDEHLKGVRATLALQRQQYLESLRLFLAAGHWPDAAYVAERVLRLEELTQFARAETHATPAAPKRAPDDYGWRSTTAERVPTADRDLRHLLARRLVRAGRFDEARDFFPPEFVADYDRYVAAVRRGYQRELPAATRADALWEAARLAHEHGMELQGFGLAPDFAIWDGAFRWPDTATARPESYRYGWDRDAAPGQLFASEDEFRRVARQQVPTRRFHYHQRATELAWLASTLLPDDDPRTAEILHTAGRWLAARYPEDAQLFYKTLVFRCPNTALGKAAAERRWFVPRLEEAPPEQSGL